MKLSVTQITVIKIASEITPTVVVAIVLVNVSVRTAMSLSKLAMKATTQVRKCIGCKDNINWNNFVPKKPNFYTPAERAEFLSIYTP